MKNVFHGCSENKFFIDISLIKKEALKSLLSERVDEETKKRRDVLRKMSEMSSEQIHKLCVKAGIYTESGELTDNYKD